MSDDIVTDKTTYFLPLFNGVCASLTARFPLTEDEWDRMITVLEVMREGLVVKDDFNIDDLRRPARDE